MDGSRVVGEVLRARAREHPDRLFWWCGEDRATYAEADSRSNRVAAGLAELGVRHGDRVAILSTNRPEFLEVIFALAKLGAIQVPLNAYLRGDFLQYQIDQAEVEVLIADAAGVEAVSAVLDRVPSLKRFVAFDDVPQPPVGVEVIPFETVRATTSAAPDVEVLPSDLVAIMYTSGTTGMPKGCMLPHGYYANIGYENGRQMQYTEGDLLWTALPLFHGAAQIVTTISALCNGLGVVVEPEFHVTEILDRWTETGATHFFAMGMMGMAMLHLPPSDKDRAHRVRGGLIVPFPPEIHRQFLERFGIDMRSEGYGQTECTPSGSTPDQRRPGSAGKPLSFYDLALVDDDDRPVPHGEVGEIVVRPKESNVMFAGYWKQPEATIAAWRNLWHHTGDYGRFDEDGFLYFVDRKKDALRRRGENISSMEVEQALMKHPKILEAAVIPVPSELTEEDVMAVIVPAFGGKPEPEELFEFFKAELPYFAVPRYVRFVDELPKTATMRVRKHLLRDQGVPADTIDFEALGLTIPRGERR